MSTHIKSITQYFQKDLVLIFFLGLAQGIPFVLTATMMITFLADMQVSKAEIGLFGLMALPYTIKFLWAPFFDGIKLPFLTKTFGRRRSWLLVTQGAILTLMLALAFVADHFNPIHFAVLCFFIAVLSASQDTVIDAFRLETLTKEMQGLGAASVQYGWRVGAFIAGFVPLVVAHHYSWSAAYLSIALIFLIPIITTLMIKEPPIEAKMKRPAGDFFRDVLVAPFKEIIKTQNIYYVFAFLILFKLGDAMAGMMTNPFLLDKAFSKLEIATIVKTYGLVATLVGLFVGGVLAHKVKLSKALLIAGILQCISNLMFVYQDFKGHDQLALLMTITVENIAGSIGSVVLVAYISNLCGLRFAATHYALLAAIPQFSRVILSSTFSSVIVHNFGWTPFFLFSTIASIPALFLIKKLHMSHIK